MDKDCWEQSMPCRDRNDVRYPGNDEAVDQGDKQVIQKRVFLKTDRPGLEPGRFFYCAIPRLGERFSRPISRPA